MLPTFNLEAARTPAIAEAERFARAFDGFKSLVVFANQDHGVAGAAQGPAPFSIQERKDHELERAVVMFDSGSIVAAE